MRRITLAIALVFVGACSHELTGPQPSLEAASPALVCDEQLTTAVTLSGSGLAPLVTNGLTPEPELDLPRVTLQRTEDLDGKAVTSTPVPVPDDPTDPAKSQVRWSSASSMTVTVSPALQLDPGLYDIEVTNRSGQSTTATGALLAVPRPRISKIVPPAMCTAAGGELAIEGDFFLTQGGSAPEVTIGGQTFTARADGCRKLPGSTGAEACTKLFVEVPTNILSAGPAEVTVKNPAPAACQSTDQQTLAMVPPPTITSVQPSELCESGGALTLEGTNFRPGSTVEVGTAATQSVVLASSSELTATFAGGLPVGGPYDVSVQTPEQCHATLAGQVTVVAAPMLFFVDPPVAYNGIAIQLTAYGSTLSANVTGISLVPASGSALALTFHQDPSHPGRLLLDLPAGVTPGTYTLTLQDDQGCTASLPNALEVVSQTTLSISSVTPSFGWTGASTGIEVRADASVGGGFQSLPRLYLTPSGGGSATARALESESFLDPSRLTAVVPEGLAVGAYDLIAVNPDGGVAVAHQAFTVTADPPPAIASLTPGSVPNSGTEDLTISGTNFATPTVTLTCTDPSGQVTTPTVTLGSSTTTSIAASFDASPYSSGAACLVRVTDGVAGSPYGEFGSLVITNPAQNLGSPSAGQALATPRRALGLVEVQTSAAARYLVAVGGAADDGSGLASLESTPLDIAGVQAGWSTQRHEMSTARAFVGAASIGRFVYAIGGATSATGPAVATVERAAVLDPAFHPDITDLDITVASPGAGLAPGVWYYRVSAVMPNDDPFNPGGEALASERFPLSLPTLTPARAFVPTITWSRLPGAVSYRIYRSPTANAPAGQEQLVSTVDASEPTRFEDTGGATSSDAPLPLGSLGTWSAVPSLSVARKGMAIAVAADPSVAGRFWLYALGGQDGSGSALASYERLQVDVAPDGSQTTGSWILGLTSLSAARWQLGAWVGTHGTSSRIPAGTTYVWAGAGLSDSGASVRYVDAAPQLPDGSLGPFQAVKQMGGRAGYGAALAGNFLYAFAGGGGTDTSVSQAEMCAPGIGGCQTTPAPPDLVNWNNATSLFRPRTLAGCALEGATIYLVGGVGESGSGSTGTTEQLTW